MAARPSSKPSKLPKFLRPREIYEQIGVSESGFRTLARTSGFPAGVLIGPRTVAYRETDVLAWLATRPTAAAGAE